MTQGAACTIGVFALLATGFLTGCDDPCGNDIAKERPSPDGRMKAVLFSRDCGASTDFSSQISILRADEALSGGGNAFSADSDHGAAKTGSWGGPTVEIAWISASTLSVSYASRARIFKSEREVNGVSLAYAEEPS